METALESDLLKEIDPEVHGFIGLEARRQRETINLIPSENYASKAVLAAQGSFLCNKYAEGYPGKRYYGGCEDVDMVERLAIGRVKELFKADHANVQPHAGAQANMAAYFAVLNFGDTVMGMSLDHGGHLTHGSPVNYSGKSYRFVHYHVNRETERIDYDEVERLAKASSPRLIVSGASAYPCIIDFERFGYIARKVGALHMADIAHIAGLIAAGLHPSPIPHADIVTSTTHKTLRSTRGAFILCRRQLAAAIDSAVFPRMQGGPFMHSIAAKAVGFHEALQPEFKQYQARVIENASALADELTRGGIRLVSGGTDNHLMLIDLSGTGVNGKQAQDALVESGIVVNRNAIPFDTQSRTITSGLRPGSPAATSRGLGTSEMRRVAQLIIRVIKDGNEPDVRRQVRQEIKQMASAFPVPGIDI